MVATLKFIPHVKLTTDGPMKYRGVSQGIPGKGP